MNYLVVSNAAAYYPSGQSLHAKPGVASSNHGWLVFLFFSEKK